MAAHSGDLASRSGHSGCPRCTDPVSGKARRVTSSFIPTLIVPRWAFERTWRFLRADGDHGVESGVIWGGRRYGATGIVLAVLYPTGNDVVRSPLQYRVGPDTAACVGQWMTKRRYRALAQVHTHPAAWVGHSWVDDHGPIVSADDFVSVVWPHFAHDLPRICELGLHVRVNGAWRRFMNAAVAEILELVDDEAVIDGHRRRVAPLDLALIAHDYR